MIFKRRSSQTTSGSANLDGSAAAMEANQASQTETPEHQADIGRDHNDARAAITSRLQIYAAGLSALGGVILGSSPETASLPLIAITFAVVGYLFVDRLKLFALPAPLAYAAMGLAAARCIFFFTELEEQGNQQIVAVAELLVLVQAILMLQEKSRRIFEQLGVFCLLQLVVAAVFNDALLYGILLIPASILGALALSSLSTFASLEDRPSTEPGSTGVATESPADATSSAITRLPSLALWATAPAILLVAAVFFYALPRTADSVRSSRGGKALVGFNDRVQLAQFGKLQQSDAIALQVRLTDRKRQAPYRAVGSLYLRGKVLERYAELSGENRRAGSGWSSIATHLLRGRTRLPREYVPSRSTDRNFYDSVDVQVVCEPMRSSAIFATSPYHASGSTQNVIHEVDRWTLRRQQADSRLPGWTYDRIKYSFGTHCFRGGLQSEWTARYASPQHKLRATVAERQSQPRRRRPNRDPQPDLYRKALLQFDASKMPTVERMATKISESIPPSKRSTVEIARRLERFLAFSGGFQYTLNLNATPTSGKDPIEQFLADDRKGHCQYFASTLVMMLRALGIPARMVVGYRTEEYNTLTEVYVARQLHAHAWVEALIDRKDLRPGKIIYGQYPAEQYWLRLDPTPGNGSGGSPNTAGVRQAFDLAQTIWEDYVVEMDGEQQEKGLLSSSGSSTAGTLGKLFSITRGLIFQIRSGRWGGGSLAIHELLSWPAAIGAIALVLLFVLVLRLGVLGSSWKPSAGLNRHPASAAAIVQVPFFADTLAQLGRLGFERKPGETPAEFVELAVDRVAHDHQVALGHPLRTLTSCFYRQRFGVDAPSASQAIPQHEIAHAMADLTQAVDTIVRAPSFREKH